MTDPKKPAAAAATASPVKDEKIIEIVGASKVFDETVAVDNIDLYVRKGEFITF